MKLGSLPEPLASWLRTLRYRPLLWMAGAALLGILWASLRVREPMGADRSQFSIYLPLLSAGLLAGLAVLHRRHPLFWRLEIALAIACCFCVHTTRRLLPPPNDISLLLLGQPPPQGPYKTKVVTVLGTVNDHPRRGDFAVEFPLWCERPYSGLVWVRAPYRTQLRSGDRVEARLELQLPQRPGSVTERASFWHYLEMGCWIQGTAQSIKPLKGSTDGTNARFATVISDWRTGLLRHYETAFNSGTGRPFGDLTAQALTAIVFGQGGLEQPLPASLRQDFKRAGLTHLLVASGTQCSLVVAALLGTARMLGMRRWPLLVVLIPSLVLYAVLAGGAPSMWRAVLAGVLITVALLFGRPSDGVSLWAGALLILLLWDPIQAWSLSLQLTFAATFGLIVLAPNIGAWLETWRVPSSLIQPLSITFGAQTATLPFTLYHFGTFSIAGLATNLLAVPLAGMLVFTGSFSLVTSAADGLNYHLTQVLLSIGHLTAGLNGSFWSGSPVSLLHSCLLALTISMPTLISAEDWETLQELSRRQLIQRHSRIRQKLTGPGTLAFFTVLLILWGSWLFWPRGDGKLRFTVLDVGQGESLLIQTPSGQNVLIDGGTSDADSRSDIGKAVIIPELQRLGVKRLDMLVLTHADSDHCSGLLTVAQEIPIGTFLDGPAATHPEPDPKATDYLRLRQELTRRKVTIRAPSPGEIYPMGQTNFQILWPRPPALPGDNNNAIVARVDYGQSRLLLTADIEADAEKALLRNGTNLRCTILKVGHHGSKTSTTPDFLNAAHPKQAVISCGRYNDFGHPSTEVLNTLLRASVPIFRTDVNGTVSFECDAAENCVAHSFR